MNSKHHIVAKSFCCLARLTFSQPCNKTIVLTPWSWIGGGRGQGGMLSVSMCYLFKSLWRNQSLIHWISFLWTKSPQVEIHMHKTAFSCMLNYAMLTTTHISIFSHKNFLIFGKLFKPLFIHLTKHFPTDISLKGGVKHPIC